MAKGFKHGAGGGASLNFDVKAYATEAQLLAATAKANTIGVVTGAPITGYIFSPVQPETITEGTVWVAVGAASTVAFNALRKNSLMVYPLYVKQYMGGAWVDKAAKSYQNGAWFDWAIFYYSAGNTFDDVTGGYISNKVDTANGTGSVTFDSNKIALVCDGEATALVRTKNKVDISGSSTLQLKVHVKVVSSYNNYGYIHFYAVENAITKLDDANGGGATAVIDYAPGTDSEKTISLDVSGITGSKYIVAALKTTQKAVDVYCDILEIKGA